jgi:hypothetical protein
VVAEWQRIGDDQFASFGHRHLVFSFVDGVYEIDVDDADQDYVYVTHQGQRHRWDVYYKEVCDRVFRLSGMNRGRGDPTGDDVYWFELTLGVPAVMRYWATV